MCVCVGGGGEGVGGSAKKNVLENVGRHALFYVYMYFDKYFLYIYFRNVYFYLILLF